MEACYFYACLAQRTWRMFSKQDSFILSIKGKESCMCTRIHKTLNEPVIPRGVNSRLNSATTDTPQKHMKKQETTNSKVLDLED